MSAQRQLRQSIRKKRLALTPSESATCAEHLAQQVCSSKFVSNSRHIAAYLAADGEIDPLPLMQYFWSLGKIIYLPVLVPFSMQKLWFAKYEAGDRLIYNRYGIAEPLRRRLIKPCALDLVLTPLVAFDQAGHRIGMGGGYYDRSFAFLAGRRYWRKPHMLGLAFEFQKQDTIKPNAWDIPLTAIATEARLYNVKPE